VWLCSVLLLCQDDIPIESLVVWAGYRVYGNLIPDKSAERVIRDAYKEALRKEEERTAEKRRIRAEKRAERIFTTTGRIVKIRVPQRTDSRSRGNSPHASSRAPSPSLDSDPESGLYNPVTTEVEISGPVGVEDEDEDVSGPIDY
jgi:hypothetical protein